MGWVLTGEAGYSQGPKIGTEACGRGKSRVCSWDCVSRWGIYS